MVVMEWDTVLRRLMYLNKSFGFLMALVEILSS
jgi:hypothetical protein